MAAFFSDIGLIELLDQALTGNAGWTAGLFTANVTPGEATVLADLVEPDGAWYARQTIPGYPASGLVGSVAETAFTGLSFGTTDGSDTVPTIYGYFILGGGGELLFAEKTNDPPIDISTPGLAITLDSIIDGQNV